jgi:hypothetical protein
MTDPAACSMSWHAQGYPSSFLTEGMFKNMMPFIHTPDEYVSFAQCPV